MFPALIALVVAFLPAPAQTVETPRPPITHVVERPVIRTVTVETIKEVPVIEYVETVREVPVIQTETVIEYVNVPTYDIDPYSGLPVTLELLYQREEAAYASGLHDGFNGPVLPACASEDSEDCYWDANTMGNGIGTSFVRWGGVTYYAE